MNTNINVTLSPLRRFRSRMLSICACVSLGLGALTPAQAQPLTLIEGFEGIVTSSTFPDPVIAAGPGSLVVMVNSQIAIHNKQGATLFQQALGGSTGFWKAQMASANVAEPCAIFDPNSGRFIVSAAEFGSAKGVLYLAISKTSNPLTSADWFKYKINRSGTHQNPAFPGVPTYPDDAKVGVDGDAIYITSGHFAKDPNITGTFSHKEIFAIAKAPLLSGGALTIVYDEPVITESYSEYLAFKIQPAIVFEPAPAMYFVQSLTRRPDDKIVVHTLSGVLTPNPVRSVALVPVAPFDRPPDVAQPGTASVLENIDARLMSAVVRDGSLWTAHAVVDLTVDAESLVRWYEFDVLSVPGSVLLTQSGNVDPGPGIHAWLPSISADVEGNMGLGFSVGGSTLFAGIAYTGRLSTDVLGSTLPVQVARSGEGTYSQYAWGEYSGLAIDPDGFTFWQFNQYAAAPNNWKTYVSAFQLAQPPLPPDPLHSADLDGASANSGKNAWKATVVVTVHDGAEAPVSGATVSVQWSGGITGTATLMTDATGRCTFVSGNIGKASPTASLTITSITHPTLTYSSAANHDPDADSNGTTITINKP
jgi:hypothetical protein